MWYFYALLGPAIWALLNHLDKYLLGRFFRGNAAGPVLARSREARFLVPITLSGEALNLLANLAVSFAGLMAPLALVSIVTGLHPLFLFVYGILFTLFLPAFAIEGVSRRHIVRKTAAIGVMCAGILITFVK